MITCIRDVRRARGMTLQDVADRCVPPTTPQTIGRLETGMRTVSVGWLARIAAALGVEAGDLVRLPDQPELPVAAILGHDGVHAPRRRGVELPPRPASGTLALRVASGVGDYRAGDIVWCEPLSPPDFGQALNRDLLVPRPAGRFLFGRLLAQDDATLRLLVAGDTVRAQTVDDPPWAAVAVRLVRSL